LSYYLVKLILSAVIIVFISEISKSNTFFGSLFASIPTISLLAIIWLFYDTGDISKIRQLSIGIFWLTLPSLVFFITFPIFLKNGFNFILSIVLSIVLTIVSYKIFIIILKKFKINL